MMYILRMALGFFADKEIWNKLITNAMKLDFSWKASAKKYDEIYANLLK